MATYDSLDRPAERQDADAPPQPAQIPVEVLRQKRAINLYFVAVSALAGVVILIPVLSILGRTMPQEIWSGWMVAIGGLIAMIGAQSGNQGNE